MISPSLLRVADIGVGLIGATLAVLVAVIKLARRAAASARQARVDQYRDVILSIAAEGDEDGAASAALRAAGARDWRAARHAVIALLGKVRGDTAETLVRLLAARGEFERARSALRSRLPLRTRTSSSPCGCTITCA